MSKIIKPIKIFALFLFTSLLLIIILMPILFFSSRNAFNAHEEKLLPHTETNKIIKTGIYAYSRNPIYLCFVLFHFGMFLIFENIMYFIFVTNISRINS